MTEIGQVMVFALLASAFVASMVGDLDAEGSAISGASRSALAHSVLVDGVVAGDDQRIARGEWEIRQVIDMGAERGGQDFAGVRAGDAR